MKTLSAAFVVGLVAGCSNMEMTTNGSGSGGMGASSDETTMRGHAGRQGSGGTVINPRTGDLTLHHGG